MAELNATLISIPAAAYLLGSIPFGLLLGKLFGAADVRKAGSGNIGATNVARVAGPLAGILTLLLDAAKGALAVLLAARLTNDSAPVDDDRRPVRSRRALLPDLAGISRRQRSGHGCGRFSGAVPARVSRGRHSIFSGCSLLAFCVAGIDVGGGGHAPADLFFLGAASRSALRRHVWLAGRGAA